VAFNKNGQKATQNDKKVIKHANVYAHKNMAKSSSHSTRTRKNTKKMVKTFMHMSFMGQ
jgi:hypothetical protein